MINIFNVIPNFETLFLAELTISSFNCSAGGSSPSITGASDVRRVMPPPVLSGTTLSPTGITAVRLEDPQPIITAWRALKQNGGQLLIYLLYPHNIMQIFHSTGKTNAH